MFLGVAVLVLVLAAGAAWWRQPPAVPSVAVTSAPLVRTLIFSARVASASRVDLGSTITGRVQTVTVDDGQPVREGQVLVRLEDDELRAALGQARANEQAAVARLAGLRGSGRRVATASVAQADSVLGAAQAELRRTEDLVARGFLSPARLDEVRRAVAVAEAQRSGAEAQRSATDERGSDVTQSEAQLAQARAAVVAADARLAQSILRAPAEGRVLVRSVEPGQIVQPGRALLTLSLAGPIELVGQVDERYLQQLEIGQEARVLADAFPESAFAARVRSIAPVVDAQRGAIEIKLGLTPPVPAFLREDMTLSVTVETGRRDRALVVPMQAVHGDAAQGVASVWIAVDGRVQSRRVRLGLRTLDAAEVLEGLAAGDQVLMGPVPEPGQRVRVAPMPHGAAAATGPTGSTGTARRDDAGSALTQSMGR
jgi:HlyD family secretion protein